MTGITGDKNPTVVITLESGVKYDYADLSESDTSASANKESNENRKATKRHPGPCFSSAERLLMVGSVDLSLTFCSETITVCMFPS